VFDDFLAGVSFLTKPDAAQANGCAPVNVNPTSLTTLLSVLTFLK